MARPSEDFLLKKRNDSPYWHYRLQGWKNFKTTGMKTRAAAKAYALEQWEKQKNEGPRTLFRNYTEGFFDLDSEWSRRHLENETLLESTIKWRARLFKTHIKDYFANVYLSDITPKMIDTWLRSLNKSGQTKDHVRVTLGIIFQEAIFERLLSDNPVIHVKKAKNDHRSYDPPTMKELLKLFPDDMDEYKELWPSIHYGIMCEIMATSGLRMQEVRALTKKALHFDKGGIVVAQAVNSDDVISLPKAKEIRVVLTPQKTLNRIAWWIEYKKLEEDALLFPGSTGKPLDRKGPHKYFNKALKEAKIKKKDRWLTTHGLRHAFNTRMREILTEAAIEGFWDEEEMCFANKLKSADEILREYTGHRSKAMTDLYDHPDLLKKLVAFQPFKIYTEKFWMIDANQIVYDKM